jgi:hypothetical protein
MTRLTSKDIVQAIREHLHPAKEAHAEIVMEEMHCGTGWSTYAETRVDVFVMALWRSKGFKKIAYEIKTSKSDFNREISDEHKRRPALWISNQFFFITPEGLVDKKKIPPECGLYEVKPDKSVFLSVPAPMRDVVPPTWAITAAMMRASFKEGRKR